MVTAPLHPFLPPPPDLLRKPSKRRSAPLLSRKQKDASVTTSPPRPSSHASNPLTSASPTTSPSTPMTWRRKLSAPLSVRRSKRWSTISATSTATESIHCDEREKEKENPPITTAEPIHSTPSKQSEEDSHISLTSSTVSYGRARVLSLFRPGTKAKFIHHASKKPADAAKSNKLLNFYGARPSDRDAVLRQRAKTMCVIEGGPGGRRSAFREEFEPLGDVAPRSFSGAAVVGRPSQSMMGEGGAGSPVSEGLVKWFRCDIFPSNAQDFHAAEAEAKTLVIAKGGTVMAEWTYPGGFMFQIPNFLPCPLPPSCPIHAPILSAHLGETGSLRVTEFQPHLEPMQQLLKLTSTNANTNSPDLVSANEFITESTEGGVEEIPLLRTSPLKNGTEQSLRSNSSISPIAKGRMLAYFQRQREVQSKKRRKREGVVYELPGSYVWDADVGTPKWKRGKLDEVVEETEDEEKGDEGEYGGWEGTVIEEGEEDYAGDEEEWVSDDGEESDDGSEFSIATGLESVRFVAECGSLF